MSKGDDWKLALEKFLLNYRNTPHSSTGVSPAQLLLKREVVTKLPQLPPADTIPQSVRQKDQTKKSQMIRNSNPGKTRNPHFQVGDIVLAKRYTVRKGQLPFYTDHYKVVSGNLDGYTIMNENGNKYRRHASDLKLLPEGTFVMPQKPKPVIPTYVSPLCRTRIRIAHPTNPTNNDNPQRDGPPPPPPRRRRQVPPAPVRSSTRIAERRSMMQ